MSNWSVVEDEAAVDLIYAIKRLFIDNVSCIGRACDNKLGDYRKRLISIINKSGVFIYGGFNDLNLTNIRSRSCSDKQQCL
jgi:hypothetical protein